MNTELLQGPQLPALSTLLEEALEQSRPLITPWLSSRPGSPERLLLIAAVTQKADVFELTRLQAVLPRISADTAALLVSNPRLLRFGEDTWKPELKDVRKAKALRQALAPQLPASAFEYVAEDGFCGRYRTLLTASRNPEVSARIARQTGGELNVRNAGETSALEALIALSEIGVRLPEPDGTARTRPALRQLSTLAGDVLMMQAQLRAQGLRTPNLQGREINSVHTAFVQLLRRLRADDRKLDSSTLQLVAGRPALDRDFPLLGKRYSFSRCTDATTLATAGEVLNNCLATYTEKMLSGESVIVIARVGSTIVAALELDREAKELRQYRLKNNSLPQGLERQLATNYLLACRIEDPVGDVLPSIRKIPALRQAMNRPIVGMNAQDI